MTATTGERESTRASFRPIYIPMDREDRERMEAFLESVQERSPTTDEEADEEG